jgi:hypothetical protein
MYFSQVFNLIDTYVQTVHLAFVVTCHKVKMKIRKITCSVYFIFYNKANMNAE